MRVFSLSLFSLICFLGQFSPLLAQYRISGTVQEAESAQPLEFATIALLQAADSSLVTGAVSNAAGDFELQGGSGSFLVKVSSLGYESFFAGPIELGPNHVSEKLPTIKLKQATTTLDEVEIAGEKSLVEFSLDKKIFNVGQDLANVGANASEILSNVPSVTVDGEGNVKLRGSSEVRILIDGRPSGMANAEGLKQLQGSLVESIEVITNPSARYEAEGNAGVINIVLKKEHKQGFNGSFEVTVGQPENYGISANINYRYRKLNFFLNYGINYRVRPNISSLYQEIYGNDTTFVQQQEREGRHEGINNNIQGGLDYYFNDRNILTASYRFQRSDGKRYTEIIYEDYLFSKANPIATSVRTQYEEESEPYSEYVLSYKKSFIRKGHELNADVRYLNYWENSDQRFEETRFLPGETIEQGTISRQNALNDEYENQYLIQVDYVQPVGEGGKLEAGLRSSFRDMTNDFLATEETEPDVWKPIPEFDNVFVYIENIHALYGIWGNKGKKLSYQVGLRGEITDVETILEKTNERNPRDYTNLFPSAHLSYHLPGENDLQISYSRRVRRPVYRELSPFITLSDGRNFFSGNPDLNPEFTHSLEVGHLKYFGKGSLSSSLYYRNSVGTIQSVRLVDAQGFSTRLPQNFNEQHAFGLEAIFGYPLTDWWKLDASLNGFRVITDGTNIDPTFESDTWTWLARQTSKFSLPGKWVVQLRGNYEAPEVMPQGRRKALYYIDLAVQKDLWNSKGRLTLNAADVFNSRVNRNIFEGETFFTDQSTQFQRRQINLSLSYRWE